MDDDLGCVCSFRFNKAGFRQMVVVVVPIFCCAADNADDGWFAG